MSIPQLSTGDMLRAAVAAGTEVLSCFLNLSKETCKRDVYKRDYKCDREDVRMSLTFFLFRLYKHRDGHF